ncbi:DUF4192 domain-containing protein [Streptomyces sp. NPDC049881]|uniref:DUF4192 domain-containing protein n=1 Tax=Streptomyces sp. NPDC049881 TaxID=3155778 RepID=UPI003424C99E
MTRHSDATSGPTATGEGGVTLRGPADLADALPHLLGFRPDDSIVLIGLHGPRGRVGGRVRTGIPADPACWTEAADQMAASLAENSARRGVRPDAAVAYLCQEPPSGTDARSCMERLRPLAQRLRTACGSLDIPVHEALYMADGRFWSYCCTGTDRCCPEDGGELPAEGTSAMAAASAYAGIPRRGSLREIEQRLLPAEGRAVPPQLRAFDDAARALLPRMLGAPADVEAVREETLGLAERLLLRLRRTADRGEGGPPAADKGDDALITSAEAARLVIGLQDRIARDRAAEWMEGGDGPPALRLWSALARRCVAAYAGHAAAPLTLAGWVAWSTGDGIGARVALGRALRADPDYVFARLLHQACNEGVDPEPLRRSMRQQRADRRRRGGGSGAL